MPELVNLETQRLEKAALLLLATSFSDDPNIKEKAKEGFNSSLEIYEKMLNAFSEILEGRKKGGAYNDEELKKFSTILLEKAIEPIIRVVEVEDKLRLTDMVKIMKKKVN